MPQQPRSTDAGPGGRGRTARRLRTAAAIPAVALAALLTGCGSIGDWAFPPASGPATPASSPTGAPPEGVSAACHAADARATPSPDLAAATPLPANWPAPPTGSELCLASVEPGDSPVATLVYATAATPEDVLAHYEAALRGGFSVERALALGGGQSLEGTGNGVTYAVTPGAGSFAIVVRADADA